jgi:hypothetical protein
MLRQLWAWLQEWRNRRQFKAYLDSFSRTAQQSFFFMAAGTNAPTTVRQVHETIIQVAEDINSDIRPGENPMPVPSLEDVRLAFDELCEGGLIVKGEGEHWQPVLYLEVG